MQFQQQHDKSYLSSVVFGTALCSVQNPEGERYGGVLGHVRRFTIAYTVDQEKLEALVPEVFELTSPEIILQIESVSDVLWLAKRELCRINVRVPVTFNGEKGLFNMVTWENNGDSIIQGREVFGIPKMYAEIKKPLAGALPEPRTLLPRLPALPAIICRWHFP